MIRSHLQAIAPTTTWRRSNPRWGRYFDHDPYYNEKLTKKYGNYRIDTDFLPASLQKQIKVWL
ncbi:MAG: hypothetical protein CM1200mP20_05260 [Pseudomonadota bacterium]|nr:MAG: hypothetical protein CM1200mP20_05260 [Pseudomonadota bacterium]